MKDKSAGMGIYVPRKPVGGQAYISYDGIHQINELLTSRSISLDTVQPKEINQILREQSGEEIHNSDIKTSSLVFSLSTRKRILRQAASIPRAANVKNTKRQENYLNIRNTLSYASLCSIIDKYGMPQLVNSSDDTSILINGWNKPRCLTTKEALEYLMQYNLGVSVVEAQKKQRVITFNFTINCERLLCSIIKVKDRNFEWTVKPKVYDMEAGLYVMMYHPDCPETALAEAMFDIIVPLLLAQRQAAIINECLNDSMSTTSVALQGAASSSAVVIDPKMAGKLSRLFKLYTQKHVTYMIYITGAYVKFKYSWFCMDGDMPIEKECREPLGYNSGQVQRFMQPHRQP